MRGRTGCRVYGMMLLAGLGGCGGHGAQHGAADATASGDALDAAADTGHGGHVMDHDAMSMVPEVLALPAQEGPFATALAEDHAAAPGLVEVHLVAQEADVVLVPGRPATRLWTYNGVLPGPRIEARVGDTVRVVLDNALPEPTTIHWHGLRVPAEMDGVLAMQSPIPPGGRFTYEFVVPDAGTFWYHPHLRSDEQVERGLYGALVVRGPDEPAVTSEAVVVLDDLLVDDELQLAPFEVDQAMGGRQGNLVLANGRVHPIAEVAPGGTNRFRFVNAANARYFHLALPGARLFQIGTDGGLLEAPRAIDRLLLVPGERADVLVQLPPDASGALTWTTLPYDRGHGTGGAPEASVFDLRVTGPAATPSPLPERLAALPALPEPTVSRTLVLEESEPGGGHNGHASFDEVAPVFSINGKVFPEGEALEGVLGDVERWTIENATPMDHPFHLHGFRFQLEGERAWRDTINVPAYTSATFRVRLEDHPGTWMFHCHILEHAEHGMMGHLDVRAP